MNNKELFMSEIIEIIERKLGDPRYCGSYNDVNINLISKESPKKIRILILDRTESTIDIYEALDIINGLKNDSNIKEINKLEKFLKI